ELHLEDIDWRGGTIGLRQRKNRRGAVVPLPREAGHALVDYLQGHRPETDERRVFVQHIGPRRGQPITATAVSEVVSRALRRAGVDPPMAGAYVFRHTLASRMVSHGASLKEVADFLGHRDLDTSAIYAKVDLPALRDAALPWPEATR
ncbi:MAG: tyrosine-type recombinase/integrase, partial [Nitriliruptorales bacterium]|nr:tyrosine-type recombinase/integrase [Nitriliruptorales bacterium]